MGRHSAKAAHAARCPTSGPTIQCSVRRNREAFLRSRSRKLPPFPGVDASSSIEFQMAVERAETRGHSCSSGWTGASKSVEVVGATG